MWPFCHCQSDLVRSDLEGGRLERVTLSSPPAPSFCDSRGLASTREPGSSAESQRDRDCALATLGHQGICALSGGIRGLSQI